jgi:sterol desaturase/sphingolipid hydroxylase (fatty acid hydroxylase superfamily)
MGIVTASIPLFFLLIALELLWSQWSGRRVVRLNDALSDLSCGILSQLAGIFSKVVTVGIFIWVGTHFALQRFVPALPAWPSGAPFASAAGFPGFRVDLPALASWSAVFVLVDFCYYWSHRLSHEVHLLWAGHVVHHSSEEYILPVALRQSALHGLMSWVFYVPLALIGVPWQMFVTSMALNLVYQFWIHTRAIGTLGPVAEYVLNTPSHHRVHHGVNPKYQDTNYGGVFIVFDRWFGTFQREEEEPTYGITTPLQSWNPLWANVHVFVEIARAAWRADSWRARGRIIFGRPAAFAAMRHAGAPAPFDASAVVPYDPPVPAPLAAYGMAQFVVALGGAYLLLRAAATLPWTQSAAAAFFLAVALAGVGGIFERAKWAGALEGARLLTLGVASAALLSTGLGPAALGWAGVVFALGSLAVLWRYRGALTEVELAPLM